MIIKTLALAFAVVVGLSGLSGCRSSQKLAKEQVGGSFSRLYRDYQRYKDRETLPYWASHVLYFDKIAEAGLYDFAKRSDNSFYARYVDGSEFKASLIKSSSKEATVHFTKINSDSSFNIRLFEKPGDSIFTYADVEVMKSGTPVFKKEHKRGFLVYKINSHTQPYDDDQYGFKNDKTPGSKLLELSLALGLGYSAEKIDSMNYAYHYIIDSNTIAYGNKVMLNGRYPYLLKKSNTESILTLGNGDAFTFNHLPNNAFENKDESQAHRYFGLYDKVLRVHTIKKQGSDTTFIITIRREIDKDSNSMTDLNVVLLKNGVAVNSEFRRSYGTGIKENIYLMDQIPYFTELLSVAYVIDYRDLRWYNFNYNYQQKKEKLRSRL